MLGLGFPGGRGDRSPRRGGTAIRCRSRVPARASLQDAGGAADRFSFSGVKTALRQYLLDRRRRARSLEDVCASFQEAIVDMLVGPTLQAAQDARRDDDRRLRAASPPTAVSRTAMTEAGTAAGLRGRVPAFRVLHRQRRHDRLRRPRCGSLRGERHDLTLNAQRRRLPIGVDA